MVTLSLQHIYKGFAISSPSVKGGEEGLFKYTFSKILALKQISFLEILLQTEVHLFHV